MNMLVDGEWRTDVSELVNDEGEFVRNETTFRDRIEDDPDAEFPAETGRYHLYISRACPWAHGTALVRSLMGLEDAISMDVVDPFRQDDGWEFSPEREGCTEDSINGFDYLHEVYTAADSDYTGRVSVPVLWDRERETIVNNESVEIMRMFASELGGVGENDADLYPEGEREAIDEVIEEIYDPINNGVYRAGFAETQEAYEDAVHDVFEAFEHWDDILAGQRYLLGDDLTLADLRLFPTLVRFDPVYHTHFKCNLRRLVDYPNLWGYTRDLYQHQGVVQTVNLDHIKEHYFRSHGDINPKRIVPAGPEIDFTEPHDRDRLAAATPEQDD